MLVGHDPAEAPRVSGRVTVRAETVNNVPSLLIVTNFVWVYAFTDEDRQPFAAAHDEITWQVPAPGEVDPDDRGLFIDEVHAYSAYIDCAASAKGLLAPAKAHAVADTQRSEDPVAALRPDHALEVHDDCEDAQPRPS